MLKILHVPTNIANQMNILSRAQRELGYYSQSCAYASDWLSYSFDGECLGLNKLSNRCHKLFRIMKFFIGAILKYNVFHFHFGNTLLPKNYDLPLLKILGKKMVMNYWGSDVRRKSINKKKNKYVKLSVEKEKLIINRMKRVSKYIDTIVLGGSYELHEYVKDYFKNVVVLPQAIDLRDYIPVIPINCNKKTVIVHAPSDKDIKGTKYILEAVSRLEKVHELEFILVHKIPHVKAKKVYMKADIVIDQILIGAYGFFSVEAMALGKPIICYIREDLRKKYPKDLPIMSATPNDIYEKLKILVENPSIRHTLGLKGREYVEKYHNCLAISKQLIELYKSL